MEKENNGGNETAKPGKNQNARRKGNLKLLENIGSWRHQTSGDERKSFKKYLRRMRKLLETKLCRRNVFKGINTWAIILVKYSILKIDWEKWTKGQGN